MVLTAADVMKKTIVVIEGWKDCHEAAQLMSQNRISCLVVVSEGKTKGLITMRDIFDKVLVAGKKAEDVEVASIMSSPIVAISPQTSMEYASKVMKEKNIKQLPVIGDNQVVGIITQTDIVLHIADLMGFDWDAMD